jgi:hypothetical protein
MVSLMGVFPQVLAFSTLLPKLVSSPYIPVTAIPVLRVSILSLLLYLLPVHHPPYQFPRSVGKFQIATTFVWEILSIKDIMAFPFGVSVGDFVTGIILLKDSLKAVSSSRGAASNYKELHRILSSLEEALTTIEALKLDGTSQRKHREAVRQAIEGCRECVNSFLTNTAQFRILDDTTRSPKRWSLEMLKTGARMVQWAICKKNDIAKFESDVQAWCDNIQMLLISFQMSVDAAFCR